LTGKPGSIGYADGSVRLESLTYFPASLQAGKPDLLQELFMGKRYAVSDGKLVLTLEEAEEGGYIVTSPLNPELITQAETIEEAFANARDAAKALRQSRAKLMRRSSASKTRG